MSSKEIDREHIFDKVKNEQINLRDASRLLALSYPQTKRIWSRYKKEGRKGLISKKRGKPSNRVVSDQKCQEIVL